MKNLNDLVSPLRLSVAIALALTQAGSAFAQEASHAPSVVSAQTLEAARAAGLDLTHMPSPGLHIVPLDESPYLAPAAARIRDEIGEQGRVGSYRAPSSEVPDLRLEAYASMSSRESGLSLDRRYRSLAEISPRLRYVPISLSGTRLESATMIEATTAGGVMDGKWTGVTRSWEVVGLGFVQLDESEYRETGGSITLVKEWVNSDVHGHPATVKTKRSADGTTLVTVGWVTDRTVYRLDLQPLDDKANQANQQALLDLARSLGG